MTVKMTDKVKQALELQEQGLEVKEVAKQLGYTDPKVYRTYMRRNGWSCVDGKYVPKEDIDVSTLEVTPTKIKTKNDVKEVKTSTNITNSNDEVMKYLISNFDKLKAILEGPTQTTNSIEPKVYSDSVNVSAKVSNEVWEEFNKYCLEHKSIRKQDWLSLALESFLNNQK